VGDTFISKFSSCDKFYKKIKVKKIKIKIKTKTNIPETEYWKIY
jgi:hypothetical protein